MKLVIAAIVAIGLTAAVASAEDLQGYVLRHNYWGASYYWVHDSSKWGYPYGTQEET